MNPKDNSLAPQEQTPANQSDEAQPKSHQEAAANIVRSQIESLYSNGPANPHTEGQAQPAQQAPTSPYDKSHTQTDPNTNLDQWKQYHSSWQDYYQKYYAGYYEHHLKNAKTSPASNSSYFTHQPIETKAEGLSKEEALLDLRKDLLVKVQKSAKNAKKSRHFMPLISSAIVVLVFAFLQYNQFIFANVAAYVSPGEIDPQNIVLDQSADISVSPDPRLIIPKINVDVPVNYDVGNDYKSQMAAMRKGVAHFAVPGASSHPGEVGNTAIAGHSSGDLFSNNEFKFIFVQLDKLVVDDNLFLNYEGKRYTYTVTKKEVVKPNRVDKLTYKTDKPVLTLITCTPIGTSENRLLVTAEQVSPSPSNAKAAPTTVVEEPAEIPSDPQNVFEKLFSGDWS